LAKSIVCLMVCANILPNCQNDQVGVLWSLDSSQAQVKKCYASQYEHAGQAANVRREETDGRAKPERTDRNRDAEEAKK